MEKKPSGLFTFFKATNKKQEEEGGGGGGHGGAWRRWKLKTSGGFQWGRRFKLHLWIVDGFLFKIVSVLETVFLVSSLCLFFLCCGCHF